MKSEKVLGYFLLAAGLVLIIFSLRAAYGVLSATAFPAQIFKINSIVLSVPAQAGNPSVSVELLSGETASKFADLTLWYMLMFFFVSGGAKIAALGIQLLKEIKVSVKGN
jgi:hypothetical protein